MRKTILITMALLIGRFAFGEDYSMEYKSTVDQPGYVHVKAKVHIVKKSSDGTPSIDIPENGDLGEQPVAPWYREWQRADGKQTPPLFRFCYALKKGEANGTFKEWSPFVNKFYQAITLMKLGGTKNLERAMDIVVKLHNMELDDKPMCAVCGLGWMIQERLWRVAGYGHESTKREEWASEFFNEMTMHMDEVHDNFVDEDSPYVNSVYWKIDMCNFIHRFEKGVGL